MEDFEVANYPDDVTPFKAKLNRKSVVEELEISSSVLFTWLPSNYTKANTDKSQLWVSGSNKLTANIDNVTESEDNQILLGKTIDSNLSFNKHINNSCKNASAKLNAPARISGYMDLPKGPMIMKSFITSQFGVLPIDLDVPL